MQAMKKEMNDALNVLIERYISDLENDLPVRWNSLDIDLSNKEVYEVLSGQLARQITLGIQFVKNPNCWTFDLAPVILRCMADNYINFSWIAKSPTDRSKKFILHGLGQEKLILEHRKNQIISDGGNPNNDQIIKYTEEWINSQRYTFLTEVNIGAWSGISTRQMAEEADCVDFYNYVYTPFSTVAHNTWGHISKYNLEVSSNPLHKFLNIPFIGGLILDIYNIRLAAKYVNKMIQKFDEVFLIKVDGDSTYEKFLLEFDIFEKRFLGSENREEQ
jgi:Family of unknown function (DUF5677)